MSEAVVHTCGICGVFQTQDWDEFQAHRTREILDMIEANGGPEGLDLSGKWLSEIDLDYDTIRAEFARMAGQGERAEPRWLSPIPDYADRGVNLMGADLQRADLSRATLQQAILSGAELQEAQLWNADLQRANLVSADLQGADLHGANLQRADLRAANLQVANLERVNLHNAVLRGADFRGADLWGADLQGADLEIARLQEANLAWAELQGAYLAGAHLQRTVLVGVNFQRALLLQADLQRATLLEAKLQGATLRRANLQRANLVSADLQGADLHGANLQGAALGEANLQEADLSGANLQGTSLSGAYLQKADLSGANLTGVNLLAAESFEGIYLYQAILDNTQITKDRLGEAVGEELADAENLADKWYRAKEAYRGLKNNFEQRGYYNDASWAYVKERKMAKATKAPWLCRRYYGERAPLWRFLRELLGRRWPAAQQWQYGKLRRRSPLVWWFWLKYTVKWLSDWFVEALCGYGESIWLVLAWMGIVLVGFAYYYQTSHGVVTTSCSTPTSIWDYLIFSLGAFTTLQSLRLQAARPGIEILTTVQAIIGIALAGLLGFVAGNRIRRS